MTAKDDDKYKKASLNVANEEETEGGESGREGESGGQTGQIEFRDFLTAGGYAREDLLPDEVKRLLKVHNTVNEANVKKQKEKREQYQALKDGKMDRDTYRQGLMQQGSQYKTHPLSQHAQFSGMDSTINMVPTEQVADTNEANRNELENQYRLRYAPEIAPKFNPKPQYR